MLWLTNSIVSFPWHAHRNGLLALRRLLEVLQEVVQRAADAEQVCRGHDDLYVDERLDDLPSKGGQAFVYDHMIRNVCKLGSSDTVAVVAGADTC